MLVGWWWKVEVNVSDADSGCDPETQSGDSGVDDSASKVDS